MNAAELLAQVVADNLGVVRADHVVRQAAKHDISRDELRKAFANSPYHHGMAARERYIHRPDFDFNTYAAWVEDVKSFNDRIEVPTGFEPDVPFDDTARLEGLING